MTTGTSAMTSASCRVASQHPARMSTNPPIVAAVICSSRNAAPTITATAGLTNVINVDRAGPTAAMRRKNSTKAIAVHSTPRAITASQAAPAARRPAS